MARNDNPDEFYSDPTQAANYGGGTGGQAYSEVPPEQHQPPTDYGYQTGYQSGYPADYQTGYAAPPEPPTPWYRKPGALVALGALAAVILALAIYAIVQLAGGSSTPTGETTTTTTTTTTEAPTETGGTQVPAPAPVPDETLTITETPTTEAPPPETTTEEPTTTTEEPTETTTTTEAPPTETVTETETVRPTWTRPTLPTLFPRPGGGDGQ
ncbi:hypothetical protein MCHIJ_05670 [Mycolicibacterium chitae]|uniref:Uncharacterized protein n=1 Tax=Mycolicibacterium chitae TaxID=1792 RepID=A0A448IC12_MYCCI|nr:hypothetical protein [Mycolicibacterium chitae]MCV7108627.1 hypothetical protein [Mycolicibacterium chitae]BBZ01130.1 hypothetical protein MCHIJ_05670 [Mycolicibacterium chitae]VEG49969.1 Uncharacterised protein [Mycolicibacterium chitae]